MGGDTQGVSAPREAAEPEKQRAGVHARTHARALIAPTLMSVNPYTKLGDPPWIYI